MIDLRQCITDEVVPVALGSSTEANTMELTATWNMHNSNKNDINATRLSLATFQRILTGNLSFNCYSVYKADSI